MDERIVIKLTAPVHELGLALISQFFPCQATENMLKIRHTFVVRVAKYFAKDGVVGDTELSFVISVINMNDLDAIRKYR